MDNVSIQLLYRQSRLLFYFSGSVGNHLSIEVYFCAVSLHSLRFARATSSDQLSAIEPLVPSSI